MAGLIAEIVLKGLGSLCFTSAFLFLFPSLTVFGDTEFQLTIVLSFYVYCFVVLFTFSPDKLFHVVSIPLFTQFLHLFQKYSFPAGANSLWRLMPFLILILYFLNFFVKKKITISAYEKLFLIVWIVLGFFYLSISPNLGPIIVGSIVLNLLILPCYFIYLRFAMQATDFCRELEKYLFVSYLILGVGTFGLVIAGAAYKGSDNLLATRNITDTNITMAYFLLLWPFAMLYGARFRQQFLRFITSSVTLAILVAVVVLSFSRGAVLLIGPFILISLWLTSRKALMLILMILSGITLLFLAQIETFLATQDLSYFWKLRFGEVSKGNAISKLLEASGRNEIQAIAYKLFLASPLVGHGTGSFEVLGPGYREAHSLWYTLLAENGLLGVILMYLLLSKCFCTVWTVNAGGRKYMVMPLSILFYLLFNHTVGSVFVIIPSKSVTVNCIAPILLICQYFYAKRQVLTYFDG
ncbi:O-antigen ligase [Dyadobacter sp. CY343]|uniref:O-antigen ligase family protein n=1 Tax=Dyadobacter sp. CY343 TaxID=2907299 RepID=UPI001F398FA9|nr:O-antigen ligase family protein [Dyadobacter sp. CY343]MCE7063526.1 O-antigen ligase family protein [Dyadobacter sp. CY343]